MVQHGSDRSRARDRYERGGRSDHDRQPGEGRGGGRAHGGGGNEAPRGEALLEKYEALISAEDREVRTCTPTVAINAFKLVFPSEIRVMVCQCVGIGQWVTAQLGHRRKRSRSVASGALRSLQSSRRGRPRRASRPPRRSARAAAHQSRPALRHHHRAIGPWTRLRPRALASLAALQACLRTWMRWL